MTMEMTEEQWSRWVIAHVFAAVHNKSLSSPSLSIRYFDFGFEFIWKSDFGDSELPLFVIVLVGLPPSLSLGRGTKKITLGIGNQNILKLSENMTLSWCGDATLPMSLSKISWLCYTCLLDRQIPSPTQTGAYVTDDVGGEVRFRTDQPLLRV